MRKERYDELRKRGNRIESERGKTETHVWWRRERQGNEKSLAERRERDREGK